MPSNLTPLAQNIIKALELLTADIEHLQSAINAIDDNRFSIVESAIFRSLTLSQQVACNSIAPNYIYDGECGYGLSCLLEYFAGEHGFDAIKACLYEVNEDATFPECYKNECSESIGGYLYTDLHISASNSHDVCFFLQVHSCNDDVEFSSYGLYRTTNKEVGELSARFTQSLYDGKFTQNKDYLKNNFQSYSGLISTPLEAKEITIDQYHMYAENFKTYEETDFINIDFMEVAKYVEAKEIKG